MVRRAAGDQSRLFGGGLVAGLSDGELLSRFLDRRGDPGAAFGALVARHGAMVARVCRGILAQEVDAEDAFQATWLVLVRRAGAISERDLLGPWLYRVALRVARRARSNAARRSGREGSQMIDGFDPPDRATVTRPGPWRDDAPTLLEEVDRLPNRYRLPVVLCHLQGLTHAEAAAELAWPVGTVSVRLARARRLLGERLSRRGVGVPDSGVALPPVVALPLAPAWVARATAAALATAPHLPLIPTLAPAAASRGAIDLARRSTPMILMLPWKWFALPTLAAALLATGAGVALIRMSPKSSPPREGDAPPAQGPVVAQAPDDSIRVRQVDSEPIVSQPITYQKGVEIRQMDGPGNPVEVSTDNARFWFRSSDRQAVRVVQDGSQVLVEAGTLEVRGELAHLDRVVRDLRQTNPAARVRLRIDPIADSDRVRLQTKDGDRRGAADLDVPTGSIELAAPAARLVELADQLRGNEPNMLFQLQIDEGTVRFGGEAFGNTTEELVRTPLVRMPPRATGFTQMKPPILDQVQLSVLSQNHEPPPAFVVSPTPTPADPRGDSAAQPSPKSQRQPTPPSEDTARPAAPNPEATDESLDLANTEVVPPVVRRADGSVHLVDPPPPGYFDLPSPPANQPNRPEPVQVGQTIVIEVLEALPGRPIRGPRVVRRDGTISLEWYGNLPVVGLNRNQIKVKLIEHLRQTLTDPTLGLIVIRQGAPGGKAQHIAVPPIESDRVFVDDQPDLTHWAAEEANRRNQPGQRPVDPAVRAMQKQMTDLTGKLDAALAALDQLRRERGEVGPTGPAGAAPSAPPISKP